MAKQINADWFIGSQNDEDLRDFKDFLNNQAGDKALMKLRYLVQRRVDSAERATTKTYDKPGWEGLMAHRNGAADMGQYVLDLLAFVKEK